MCDDRMTGEAPSDDEDDAVREAACVALECLLVACCHGNEAGVAISALAGALQDIVALAAKDLAGIDAFAEIFHDELRQHWLRVQPTGEEVS